MMIRRLFGVSLAIAALTFPSPIRADDEAAALLAKHKAYVGWEFGDGTFKTMRVETSTTQVGKDGKPEEISRAVDLQRGVVNHLTRITTATGLRSDAGFTGSVYWLSNRNGFTIPRLDDGRKMILAAAILFGEGTTTLPGAVIRRESIGATPTVVVREQIPNAVSLDLYIDPTSGAYKRAVIDADGTPTQIVIDGYGEVAPGKRAITAYHYSGEDSHRTRVITPNVAIDDSEFRPPAPLASWTFGSGKPFYIDVQEFRIFVDAKVNGVAGRFILDTGAGAGILFTSAFAAKAGVHALPGTVTSIGATGASTMLQGRIDAIEFGDGSKLQNVVVTTGTSGNLGSDGLMGFDFLAGAIVEVDLDAKQMTLYDPKLAAPSDAGGVVVVPDLSNGSPVVPAKLNGTILTRGLLDSGNPSTVLLNSEMKGKTRTIVDKNQLAAQRLMGGVGDRSTIGECGQLGSIDLGRLHYEHVPVCFAPTWPEDETLLGLDFIKNFNLVIDYPDDKIILFPRKKYQ